MADKPESAPASCPGTQSDQAGKADGCAGCPMQAKCASGATKGPDPDVVEIGERLKSVRNVIVILSGKGGVGKSTVTAILGQALAQSSQVGIMDVDICGPSQPTILGLKGEQVHQSGSGWSPVFADENLCLMSVGFLLNDDNEAVIWRGPRKNGLIKQFLRDVDWGEDLDYLLVDTPPGTSDEHISIVQYLADCNVKGALLVTTPQEVSLQDVRKEISFCRKVKLPILGVIENMRGFVCPNCACQSEIFAVTTGGAKAMCEQENIPFLGSVPLDPRITKCCDEGKTFLSEFSDTQTATAYKQIIAKIIASCEKPGDS